MRHMGTCGTETIGLTDEAVISGAPKLHTDIASQQVTIPKHMVGPRSKIVLYISCSEGIL